MHPNWASAWDCANFESGLTEFGVPWPSVGKFAEEERKKEIAYRLVILHEKISEILSCCIFHS